MGFFSIPAVSGGNGAPFSRFNGILGPTLESQGAGTDVIMFTHEMPANTLVAGDTLGVWGWLEVIARNSDGLKTKLKFNGSLIVETGFVAIGAPPGKTGFDFVDLSVIEDSLGAPDPTTLRIFNDFLQADTTFDASINNTVTLEAEWSGFASALNTYRGMQLGLFRHR